MKKEEITIIGAGVVGLCSAYYAVKAGHRVRVIDAHTDGHEGTSYGNAGMVVPSHFIPLASPGMIAKGLRWMLSSESPFFIRPRLDFDLIQWGLLFWKHATKQHTENCKELLAEMHLASRELYQNLAEELGFELTQKGLLMLCKSQKTLDSEAKSAVLSSSVGVKSEVCDSKRIKELDPNINMNVVGGVWYEQDCHFSPSQLMVKLSQFLQKAGVEFIYATQIEKFNVENGKVSHLQTQTGALLPVSKLILAAGAWTPKLTKKLGIKLPMQAGKGYSLTLEKPSELPKLCSILCEAKVAVTPMGENLRFAGTMEIGSLNQSISKNRVRGIVKSIPDYFPNFQEEDFATIKPWVGLRPCSPDGIPYIGSLKNFANVTIAAGHGMMGISMAPITGKMLAEGFKDAESIQRLCPSRFQNPSRKSGPMS
jgi:D-amino-acid dehydrogenase